MRVKLAASIDADFPLPASALVEEPSDLFARMLTAELVADDEVSFERFRGAGWDAIGPAIKASDAITSFLPAIRSCCWGWSMRCSPTPTPGRSSVT